MPENILLRADLEIEQARAAANKLQQSIDKSLRRTEASFKKVDASIATMAKRITKMGTGIRDSSATSVRSLKTVSTALTKVSGDFQGVGLVAGKSFARIDRSITDISGRIRILRGEIRGLTRDLAGVSGARAGGAAAAGGAVGGIGLGGVAAAAGIGGAVARGGRRPPTPGGRPTRGPTRGIGKIRQLIDRKYGIDISTSLIRQTALAFGTDDPDKIAGFLGYDVGQVRAPGPKPGPSRRIRITPTRAERRVGSDIETAVLRSQADSINRAKVAQRRLQFGTTADDKVYERIRGAGLKAGRGVRDFGVRAGRGIRDFGVGGFDKGRGGIERLLGAGARGGGRVLGGIGRGAIGLGRPLAPIAALAGAAGIKASLEASIKFETSLAKIKALGGDTAKSMAQVKAEVLALGKEGGQGVDDLLE